MLWDGGGGRIDPKHIFIVLMIVLCLNSMHHYNIIYYFYTTVKNFAKNRIISLKTLMIKVKKFYQVFPQLSIAFM